MRQAHCGSEVDAMLFEQTEVQPSALLTPEVEANLCLTPEQREAKLRRVERIRERVIRRWTDFYFFFMFFLVTNSLNVVPANCWFHPLISAARESACAPSPTTAGGEGKEARKGTSDMARRLKSGIIYSRRTALKDTAFLVKTQQANCLPF